MMATTSLDPNDLPSAAFREEVNLKYLQSHHQQMHFQQIVGQRSWALSLTPSDSHHYGKLRLGVTPDELESCYSIQFLGRACFLEQTWQWGWAHDLLPLDLVQGVLEIRDKLSHVPEFQVAKFSLPTTTTTRDPRAFCLQLASVGCAHMTHAKAFFAAPHGMDGYLLVALVDDDLPSPRLETRSLIQEIQSVIHETDFLTNVPLAIHSFLTYLGAIQLLVAHPTAGEHTTFRYAFPALPVGSIYVTLGESGQFQKISATK